MIDNVKSSEPLQPVKVVQRPGSGTDIWLRRNITGPLTEESEEGFTNAYYEAEEAFLRTTEPISAEKIEADFDGFWSRAAAYDPHLPPSSDKERIAQLERQNAMLTECLLEMSEIVYA